MIDMTLLLLQKYMDTSTVNTSTNVYGTTFPFDMIFTKADESTSDLQVEKLTREFNIHYRACIGSFIYLLSTRVDLRFEVQELEKFSSNPGKVQFKGLVHCFRYIRDNKTLGLNYYTDIKIHLYLNCRDKLSLRLRIN